MRRASFLVLYLYLFSVAFHGFIGWRLLPDLQAPALVTSLLWGLLALSAWLVPAALIGTRKPHSRFNDAVAWGGFFFMGLASTLFVLTLLRDLVLLALWLLSLTGVASAAGNEAEHWSALAVLVASALITLIGFVNARRAPAVVQVDVPITDLPPALQGFTIAQISDIHVGPTIRGNYLQAIVTRVNALQADLIALTGDLVDGRVETLAPHVEPLRALTARHGTYFVTGNHEYYSGAHHWIAHLRTLGLNVLLNEHVALEHEGGTLVVAGITDYSAHQFDEAHRSDPQGAVANAPAHAHARILLAHQPRSIFHAENAGYHLQISGHTHGGQFLPWNWFVPLQQPFTAGLHRHQSLWIYISRGTGYWGPPKRFGAPAEITQLRLVKAEPPF